MCNFYANKFKEINQLKVSMLFAIDENSRVYYKNRLRKIFDEFLEYELDNKESKDIEEFTIEELEEYDGENGKPAYIAIDGIVYDVTSVEQLKEEPHLELEFGSDLTMIFKKCHGDNSGILIGIPIIGTVVASK